MKVSRTWLERYFDAPLPPAETVAEAITFHAAEIDEVAGDMLDVKVLPDRAAYMLCHRGVALETAASLGLALAKDPFKEDLPEYPVTNALSVAIEDSAKCARYMGALVRGVKIGPSPSWLKDALESVGQRSINNVVDATNYVMLDIGQPLHAFDAKKLGVKNGMQAIQVRGALEGERITLLSGEECVLPEETLLIVDKNADAPIGIAGVKGGKAAEIEAETTDIVVESASFDGTSVRLAAQALKLWTDASSRFQNKPSPALAAYGMRDVLALITEIAGGTVEGVVDTYPSPMEIEPVAASLSDLNGRLGSAFTMEEVRSVFDRLGFSYSTAEEVFTVLPPFERRDIRLKEDLAEEVGRILGYDRIPSIDLPLQEVAPDQARYRGIERVKDYLVERGFSEVSTQSFATEGDIELANPLQADRPWLRASLLPNVDDALSRAALAAPRIVGPDASIRLFEIGNVFTADGEMLLLALGARPLAGKLPPDLIKDVVAALEQELFMEPAQARYSLDGNLVELNLSKLNLAKVGDDYAPLAPALGAYRPFSPYPFALRDIAVWTPTGTKESEVANCIMSAAGDLLVRLDLFDEFEKDGRISYAFRLVFESMERTLSDTDLAPVMQRITEALSARAGYAVR